MRPLDEALKILANYYDKLQNVERKKFGDFVAFLSSLVICLLSFRNWALTLFNNSSGSANLSP